MFIFLDEAGDLGFDFSKAGTSKTFTITLLVCHDTQTLQGIQKAVKRTLKNKVNSGKKKKRIVQELKGNSTTHEVKSYFLRQMPPDGWEVLTIVLHKENAYDHLRTTVGKQKLYNFLTKELLKTFRKKGANIETVNLVVDKCKDGDGRKDFDTYIKANLETSFPLETQIYITHEDSQSNAGLQAVDMFCWGIQRKDNCNDSRWYREFSGYVSRYIPYLKAGHKK